MFCNNCGKKLDADSVFCTGCGKLAEPAEAAPPPVVEKDMDLSEDDIKVIQAYRTQGDSGKRVLEKEYPHIDFEGYKKKTIDESMGKLLVSGDGEENSAVGSTWLLGLFLGAISVGLSIFAANEFGYTQLPWVGPVRNDAYNIFIGFAVVAGIVTIADTIFKHVRITDTKINVHEKGVKGRGVPAKFPWTFFSYSAVPEFQLGFDQIMSVDVLNGNCVVIHVIGASHKCYCPRPEEIRNAIIKQKSETKIEVAAKLNICTCGYTNPEGLKFCGKCGNSL
jgi:hypothetical protein